MSQTPSVTAHEVTAIILAAGLGTRMKSSLPKAMHPLGGVPMIKLLIDKAAQIFDRIIVVVGPDMDDIASCVTPHKVIVQNERAGTGHAARQAAAEFGDGDVAILYADNPLISVPLMQQLVAPRPEGVMLRLLAMRPKDPGRYGRLVTSGGDVKRIIEWKDATEDERAIPICNAGMLCAAASDMRRWLGALTRDNVQGEYYLTDVVEQAAGEGRVTYIEGSEAELAGVNSRVELAAAERTLQAQLRVAAMAEGVTLVAPETVFLAADTELSPDCVIEPHVVFGPGVRLGRGVHVRAFSHLEGCIVGEDARIGPFARLRPGTVCASETHIGNFVELKATQLGHGSKVNHLSYIGDAEIGAGTNIGAGSITCNYDGMFKHKTSIGAHAFIGSNTIMVAPIRIGDATLVAAGSVLTENVADTDFAVARARQVAKSGRGQQMQDALKAKKEKS